MGRKLWAGLVGVLVAAAAFAIFCMPMCGEKYTARRDDSNDLRNIVGLVVAARNLPLKDGAFDPYAFFRSGEIRAEYLWVFRSDRSKTGPTEEEVKRGNYTNFPWERYRGDGKLEGPPVPLLWEKGPDDDGKVLVGLSDGTAACWDYATLKAVLQKSR